MGRSRGTSLIFPFFLRACAVGDAALLGVPAACSGGDACRTRGHVPHCDDERMWGMRWGTECVAAESECDARRDKGRRGVRAGGGATPGVAPVYVLACVCVCVYVCVYSCFVYLCA